MAAGATIHAVVENDEAPRSFDRRGADEDGAGGNAGIAGSAAAAAGAGRAWRAVARKVGDSAARERLDDGVGIDLDAAGIDLEVAPPQDVGAAVEHQHVVAGVEFDADALVVAEIEHLLERHGGFRERRLRCGDCDQQRAQPCAHAKQRGHGAGSCSEVPAVPGDPDLPGCAPEMRPPCAPSLPPLPHPIAPAPPRPPVPGLPGWPGLPPAPGAPAAVLTTKCLLLISGVRVAE